MQVNLRFFKNLKYLVMWTSLFNTKNDGNLVELNCLNLLLFFIANQDKYALSRLLQLCVRNIKS